MEYISVLIVFILLFLLVMTKRNKRINTIRTEIYSMSLSRREIWHFK